MIRWLSSDSGIPQAKYCFSSWRTLAGFLFLGNELENISETSKQWLEFIFWFVKWLFPSLIRTLSPSCGIEILVCKQKRGTAGYHIHYRKQPSQNFHAKMIVVFQAIWGTGGCLINVKFWTLGNAALFFLIYDRCYTFPNWSINSCLKVSVNSPSFFYSPHTQ